MGCEWEGRAIGKKNWYISVILVDKEKCETENNQCPFLTWSISSTSTAYIPAYDHNGFTMNGREIC
jgi:hypothetical protein